MGGDTAHDLGNVVLFPGFVNAHTHLEFSYRPRPLGAPGMNLPEWIRLVIGERQRIITPVGDAIAAGVRESLQNGVTTLGEISTAAEGASYEIIDLSLFLEVIGFSRARAESALAAVSERLGTLKQAANNGRIQLGISPHAPYTVSPDLLMRLVQLATECNVPIAMHVAESEAELELLARGAGAFQSLLDERSMWDATAISVGSRALDYMKVLADAPRALVIHGNYLDATEHAFLAKHSDRMSLVYCPRTHAYFGHPPYPLADLLRVGVCVALGTDSRASNPDLSLLSEMRHVASTHPSIAPSDILRLGTLAGAKALGRTQECGSLTPGKLADLVAVPLPSEPTSVAEEMLKAVLTTDVAPTKVWLRGKEVHPLSGAS